MFNSFSVNSNPAFLAFSMVKSIVISIGLTPKEPDSNDCPQYLLFAISVNDILIASLMESALSLPIIPVLTISSISPIKPFFRALIIARSIGLYRSKW